MFMSCEKLESLDLSGFDMTHVPYKNKANMFQSCKALKTIYMRGCDEGTVNKIKSSLSSDGISGQVTIITE